MTYQGIVQDGVVVLPAGVVLPEGTHVTVVPSSNLASEPAIEASLPIGKKLARLAHWSESQPSDLPADLAMNHDHYLHGLPKKK